MIPFLMGKYLKANQTVDGVRGDRRRMVLPTGQVRLNFGLIVRRQLSPEFFSALRSTPRQSERGAAGSAGILF